MIKLRVNCNGLALGQGLFIFVVLFSMFKFKYLWNQKWFQKNRHKKNKFFFCKNKGKNKLIFENWDRSVEWVPFNIKRMRDRTDSFLKATLETRLVNLFDYHCFYQCVLFIIVSYLYIYKLRSTNFINYILNPSTLTRAKRRINSTVICRQIFVWTLIHRYPIYIHDKSNQTVSK